MRRILVIAGILFASVFAYAQEKLIYEMYTEQKVDGEIIYNANVATNCEALFQLGGF